MQNSRPAFSIPVEALGICDVEIIKAELNRSHEFIVTVASTKKEIPCHQCGRLTEPHGKGRTVQLRHLYMFGKKTFIEITPPRGCYSCIIVNNRVVVS